MRWRKTACILLAATVLMTSTEHVTATISNIQSQKAQNEKEQNNIKSKISNLEGQKSALNNEVSGLNDELTDTL